MTSGYYRQPAIHRDTIVFVCEDDLWSVPVGGGVARRLTANPGLVAFPRISPDGKRIAFTRTEDGPAEVYVMDADGDAPRRLTFSGGDMLRTVGWSRGGTSIVFQSNDGEPFRGKLHLFEVPARGGPARRLPFGPAREIAYEPGGKGVVLGINSGDPARWKRYRGGTAGVLWVDREGKGAFKPLIELEGNLAGPLWIGRRIYFLSDHEGCGNLYSCTPTGRGLRRHTNHDDFYVRFPAADGRTIVYHAGADLFVHDTKSGEERRVEVAWQSPRTQRRRKFVSAPEYLESADLHPEGHSAACVARGGAFSLGLWEGAPLRHGPVSQARQRLARWLPDGKRLVVVTDERGEEELQVVRGTGGGRPNRIRGDFGRILTVDVAPKGNRLAITNHRQEIWLVDLKAARGQRLDKSAHNRIQGAAWSPDGRWLAYGFPATRSACCLRLYDTQAKKRKDATRPEFWDFGPSFDPAGKHLYFLSRRVFDPVYDQQYFDLGFPRGAQPMLVTLKASEPSPFAAATRTPRPPRVSGDDDKKKDKPARAVGIDFAGIADRVVAFPVSEARYEKIRGGFGRVFFSYVPVEGSLGQLWYAEGEPPAKAHVEVHDFAQDKTEAFYDGVTDFDLSLDRKTVLLRVGNRLRALPAAIEPKDVSESEECGRASGWVDLERIRLAVEPADEWRQMFREAWRLQRDQFWTEDMSAVDWQAVHDRYLPLVDRVGCRSEFSDLMWEMQGELGTSHCYELGGDYAPPPEWFQGLLGADLEFSGKPRRWRVARIPRGDSWNAEARSPLSAPGLGVRAGHEIVAVDGRRVGKDLSPHACLVNQAGCAVRLTLRAGGKLREVVVTTLETEQPLRYRDWVEKNRAAVHDATKGKVGYVHIPNMGPLGYSEFHRYFKQEVDRLGLVVDVRWNGGGHVSQLLLEKLLRRRIGYDRSRWMGVESYPTDAPMGPMVALTNEYAGSDGDMFSHAWKIYGLGPLIGKRTWGGVVGIWPRHALVDGTITTQAEFAFWFRDVGYGVENYGTDPDLDVDIAPQDHARGRDTQLETGIREVLRIVREKRPAVPKMEPRPKLTPPRLPRS